MKRLVVVGNGFDLHHNMETSYWNYREYLIAIGREDIVACFEDMEFDSGEKWTNLEERIGMIDYENAYCYLLPYGSDEWKDSAHHDFQYEIGKKTEYWPDIKNLLGKWVRDVEYTSCDKKLKSIINNDSRFLSFNYTNTLEVLYGIDKKKICYIHGDASQTDNLILGHRNDDYYPEWDPYNDDTDVRLLEAGEIMEGHRQESMKPVEEIIESNSLFFQSLHEIEEIYVIGISYNLVDIFYFEELAKYNQSAKWYFNAYKADDLQGIAQYVNGMGITNYEIIDIEQW